MTATRGQRTCIFCGGTPLTAEHAWPQWMAKYLPGDKIPHMVIAQHEDRGDSMSFRGERLPFTTEVRCVCEACNTGWMHELEMTAEPLLAPLVTGKRQVWHEWKQSLAAAWAFKTVAVLEYAVGVDQAIPAEILPQFRRYLTPPPGTQIWTARYTGDAAHQFGSGAIRVLVTSNGEVQVSEDKAMFGAFVQVGALVLRVRGNLIRNGPSEIPGAAMAAQLVPIWPVRARAEWPPRDGVDDDGLHNLVSSMADESTIGDPGSPA